jgi:cell division septum initiation protein DivIVA
MSALEQENEVLKTSLESLQKQVETLKAMVNAEPQQVEYRAEPMGITASDLLEDDPVQAPRRGRPPKQVPAVETVEV